MREIRPNFSEMTEPDRHDFFWNYAESRETDFRNYSLVTVKLKKSSSSTSKSKEAKLKLTPAQIALLKTLGLV
jgi:hypothetical protein